MTTHEPSVSFSLVFSSHPLHWQGNRMDEQRCTFPPPLKVELSTQCYSQDAIIVLRLLHYILLCFSVYHALKCSQLLP